MEIEIDEELYTVQRIKSEDDEGAIWTTTCTLKREYERVDDAGERAWREQREAEKQEWT